MRDLEFILTVKEHEILYNSYNTRNSGEIDRAEIWESLAKNFGLQNGMEAQKKWLQLTQKYIQYLICADAESFPYAEAMQFMQQHIIGGSYTESLQSDLDIDETELEAMLYSDEEFGANDAEDAQLKERSGKTDATVKEAANIKQEEHVDDTSALSANNFIPLEETADSGVCSNNSNSNRALAMSLGILSPLELIFLGYARELQKMPLRLQILTKRKIADIIDEAKMELMES